MKNTSHSHSQTLKGEGFFSGLCIFKLNLLFSRGTLFCCSIQRGHSNSIFVILQLDRRIIDNFEGWKYVRTKVITFVPAKAKACSLDELQSPPDGSGLMLNSTEAIEFNQYAVFNCPDDQVTDDGPLFKIKCLPNGQYQSRKWGACRERKVCEIRPPKPPTKYGLARDNTRGIKEFENATYACKDPNMVQ